MLTLNSSLSLSSCAPAVELGVVDQVRVALKARNLLAMACGALLGGFAPVASYLVAHVEAAHNPALWALAVGGMLFSSLTVFDWARRAFDNDAKALGFVVLTEGIMAFASLPMLSLAALAVLVAINAVGTGCRLVSDQRRGQRRSARAASSDKPAETPTAAPRRKRRTVKPVAVAVAPMVAPIAIEPIAVEPELVQEAA